MPQEPAVIRGGTARAVLGIVEYRVAVPQPVNPGLEVREPETQFQRQPLIHLPGVLRKTFVRLVSNIVEAVEGSLVISVGNVSGYQVGKQVAV